jgi:hypothetical protein
MTNLAIKRMVTWKPGLARQRRRPKYGSAPPATLTSSGLCSSIHDCVLRVVVYTYNIQIM